MEPIFGGGGRNLGEEEPLRRWRGEEEGLGEARGQLVARGVTQVQHTHNTRGEAYRSAAENSLGRLLLLRRLKTKDNENLKLLGFPKFLAKLMFIGRYFTPKSKL